MSAPHRISAIVYASLTVLAVAAAASAKGYVDSLSEFSFVVLVTAAGLVVAHFWSTTLSVRLTAPGRLTRDWLAREAIGSSVMMVPAVLMVAVAGVAWLITGTLETTVTAAMLGLVVALFAFTWVGSHARVGRGRAALWALGTAAVGVVMTVFKVLA